MRFLLVLGALALATLRPALAQTTFTPGGECSSGITISGGVTLTAAATTAYKLCVAGNPKFSGKWYFTYVPSVASGHGGVGLSSGLKVNGIAGGVDPATCNDIQCNTGPWDLIYSGNGGIIWGAYNLLSTNTGTAAAGVTAAVVVDLDTDPNQYWFTPNVAGTTGFGGGPLWNGDANSSPEVHGTGFITTEGQEIATPVCLVPRGTRPTCGTGFPFGLPGQLQYPTAFIQKGDALTFNFNANATLATKIPSYAPWNTTGGEPPTPGPNHPLEVQISNAPGWTPGARDPGYRVNAGPAWNGTTYTNGANLCLFAVVTGGTTGRDPTVFNTACNSGTPANRGGVPTATWASATKVTDGSVVWALLSRVDEISISVAFHENNSPWAKNKVYINGQYVLNGTKLYRNTVGEYPPNPTCTSASSGTGPTGTIFNGGIIDGTCNWAYRGTVIYTSHRAIPAHQTCYQNVCNMQIFYDINFNLWWGGTGRPTYWAGHDGELDPIMMFDIQDFYGEGGYGCYHQAYARNGGFYLAIGHCNNRSWYMTVQPAPGDGFADNLTATNGPLGYPDSSHGVELFSDTVPNGGVNGTGPAVYADISGLHFKGLQIYSVHGAAIGGNGENMTDGWVGHVNTMWLEKNILYAGGGHGIVTSDAGTLAENNVFIYAGTTEPCYGLYQKFNGWDTNNTFIGPGSSLNCSAILDYEPFMNGHAPRVPKYNNATFGFRHPWTTGQGWVPLDRTVGNYNVTDVSAGYTPTSFTFNNVTYNTQQLVGTTVKGASASAAFINPTVGSSMDLRVRDTSSPLYGAGGTYTFNPFTVDFEPYPFTPTGPDIFRQTRPATGPRYDVGAVQYLSGGGTPPPATSVLRRK